MQFSKDLYLDQDTQGVLVLFIYPYRILCEATGTLYMNSQKAGDRESQEDV